MALTKYEKSALDKVVKEVIMDKIKDVKKIEIYDLIDDITEKMLDFNIVLTRPSQSISYSLERIKPTLITCGFIVRRSTIFNIEDDSVYIYSFNKTKKDKNKLYFGTSNKHFYYDFITQEFSFGNKECLFESDTIKKYFQIVKQLLKYEWLFNYMTSVYEFESLLVDFDEEEYEKMPPNFYNNVIAPNGGRFEVEELKKYLFYLKYGKYSTFYYALCEKCSNNKAIKYFENNNLLPTMLKIYKTSMLTAPFIDEWTYAGLMTHFYNLVRNGYKVELDGNRDIKYNLSTIEAIENEEKNNILAKNLQQLNFINNYKKDNLEIIVPQSIEDLVNEGKMQNNCVGHYYNNFVMEGRCLLYFIRLADNINKSYITCRYDLKSRKTVECRYKNNKVVTSKYDTNFIQEIDKQIRQNLI